MLYNYNDENNLMIFIPNFVSIEYIKDNIRYSNEYPILSTYINYYYKLKNGQFNNSLKYIISINNFENS